MRSKIAMRKRAEGEVNGLPCGEQGEQVDADPFNASVARREHTQALAE